MLDEFVYQFQSFAQWREKVKNKSEDELGMLAENSQVRLVQVDRSRYPRGVAEANRLSSPPGLVMLLCPQRPLLARPKVQDQRAVGR
jgi:hypothetical protein